MPTCFGVAATRQKARAQAGIPRLRWITGVGAAAGATIGVVALAEWAFGIEVLARWSPGGEAVTADAAVCLVLLAAATWALWAPRSGAAAVLSRVPALVAGLLGALVLFEYLADVDLGIDELLVLDVPREGLPSHPDRMSPIAATGIVLLAVASLLTDVALRDGRLPSQVLAIACALLAMHAFTAYAYGEEAIIGPPAVTAIALPTAVALLALAAAILFARPGQGLLSMISEDSLAGLALRHALPAALVLPFLVEWLHVLGEQTGRYETASGSTLVTLAIAVTLALVTWGWAGAVVRVMTERSRTQDALRHRTADLEVTQSISHIGSWEFDLSDLRDLNANPLRWSPEVYRIFGYEPGTFDVTNDAFFRAVPPQEHTAIRAAVADAIAKGSLYAMEHHVIRPDGSLRVVQERGDVLKDAEGRRTRMVGTVEDVTDIRQAQREIEVSEARKTAMLDAALDPVITMDARGEVVEWNPAATRTFGYTAQEAVGLELATLIIPEGMRERHRQGLARYLRTGEGPVLGRTVTFDTLRRDGTLFPAEISIVAFTAGDVPLFTGFIRDVTASRRAEAELRQLNEALEQRVAARTGDLTAANEELESFAYSVSHDLRTPLRAISAFSQLLREEHAAQLDANGKNLLARILAATKRMGSLIEDLLRLSQVTRVQTQRTDVDLGAVAREVIDALTPLVGVRDVEWVIADGLHVQGDRALLRVALENLLGNALKFTAPRAHARIELGVETKAGERVYFVRDNGVGFDNRNAERLFHPFQRLHADKEFEGTGIGLATVARIIRRHGGRYCAESAVQGGATIWFTLG